MTPGFENVEKIYDWDEVWPRMLDESPKDRVDSRAYLRARLLDMFIGDWDRHQRQWSWARVRGQDLLQPFPEDRDQAFAKFDGALMAIARLGQPRFVNFESKYPEVLGLNWAARFMDRRVLGDLDAAAWDEAVREVQEALSDDVLDEAVRRMPPEYYRIVGPRMLAKLRDRRARLPEFARRYYGTHRARSGGLGHEPGGRRGHPEERGRVGPGHALRARARRARPGSPYFRRLFRPSETREIRIFLQGGDDRAVSHPPSCDSPIEVRVVGDGGNDVADDSQGGGTHFYDAEGKNQLVEGPGSADSDKPFVPVVDYLGDPLLDWGSATGPVAWVSALPDVGRAPRAQGAEDRLRLPEVSLPVPAGPRGRVFDGAEDGPGPVRRRLPAHELAQAHAAPAARLRTSSSSGSTGTATRRRRRGTKSSIGPASGSTCSSRGSASASSTSTGGSAPP